MPIGLDHILQVSINSTSEEVRSLEHKGYFRHGEEKVVSINSTSEEVRSFDLIKNCALTKFPLIQLPRKSEVSIFFITTSPMWFLFPLIQLPRKSEAFTNYSEALTVF